MAQEKILVVEDEGITVLHIRKALEALGYAVAEVSTSAEEAISKAAAIRPDLVLMDIVLQGPFDGIEAAEKIRSDLNIPVIYLTAHADESTLQRAKITEPFGYIVKPFRERDLYISIEFALYKARSEMRMRKLNRALQQRTADLEAANRDLESFSYAVSHDLKAPLRAIEGFSGMLLEDQGTRMDENGRNMLIRVSGNTKKMKNLIDDLLQFSRIGVKDIQRSETDLKKLAGKIAEEVRSSDVPDRAVDFSIGDAPPAVCDESVMAQVFTNLFSNALKFTRGRDIAKIEFGGGTSGKENVYFVKDNGIGFDMQFADKLFGLFQRLHASDPIEGTGVGLVIVKRIIEKHGGRVWAEARPGKGAEFYFTLPVMPPGEPLV